MSPAWLRTRPRTKDALALTLLTVLWGLFFWRILTPNPQDRLELRHGDLTLQFLAIRQRAYADFLGGRFPSIEECIYSGYPLQEDPQAQLTYPPQWAMFALGGALGWPSYPLRALEWEVMLHVWLGAANAYVLLRTLGLRRAASLLGALTFGFGGFMTGFPLLQIAILFSAAWAPLVLAGVWKVAGAPAPAPARDAARVAIPAALCFFGGNVQMFMFTAFAGAVIYLARGREAGRAWRALALRALPLALVALGLCAPALIPQALFTVNSTRAALPYDAVAAGLLPRDLALAVMPGVSAVWWPLFAGSAALLLALAGLRWRWGETRLWLWIGLGALVLSFGLHVAGYELAYLGVPGYGTFRQQERHALIVALAISVLAAHGAQVVLMDATWRLRAWLARRSRDVALLALAGLAVVVLGQVAARAWPAQAGPQAGEALDRLALMTLALGALAALIRARAARTAAGVAWFGLLLALVTFEVFSASRNNPEATQKPADPFPPSALLRPVLAADAPYDPRITRVNNHFGLALNEACVNGVREIGGGSPISLGGYDAFVRRVPEEISTRLLNVRYTVTWRGGMGTDSGATIPARKLASDSYNGTPANTFALDWEPPGDWRAWLAGQMTPLADADALYARMNTAGFNPLSEALVYAREWAPGPQPAGSAQRAAVEGMSSGYYKIAADAPAPTLLVVSEAYHWNWRAVVNGQPAQVLRADGALIGVPVPAGHVTVELSYRPDDFYIGLALAALTLLALVAALFRSRARS